jgi:glycosyltransferase involved in cell wall biosynthesis
LKKVLHISYDLRDGNNDEVTTAVSNLINASKKDSEPIIIDLVRVSHINQEKIRLIKPSHLAINVFGLPYGLLMSWTQKRATNFIIKANSDELINLNEIEIVHAHKLTFEGIVGYNLSRQLDVPLLVTLRQTDIRVFTKNPFTIYKFRSIIKHCHIFIYLIPQILLKMEKIFGKSFYYNFILPRSVLIPNIVDRVISHENLLVDKKMLLTILRMTKKSVYRKNLKRLLLAFKLLNRNDLKLKIVGEGSYKPTVQKLVNKFRLNNLVIFEGAIPNEKIDKYYLTAQAFVLPSLSESFGMVYAEALLNGTPIMFSKNHLGFDGFFEGVGVGVNPNSVESIRDGLEDLLQNGSLYRKNISSLRESGKLKIFSSDSIATKYKKIIEDCGSGFKA